MVSIREWLTVGEVDDRVAESALLRAGRSGDRAALEQLLARHKRPLLALCYGTLGHAEDAEDAVGETILLALHRHDGARGGASRSSWLALLWARSRRAPSFSFPARSISWRALCSA
jgi:hypothetical protein